MTARPTPPDPPLRMHTPGPIPPIDDDDDDDDDDQRGGGGGGNIDPDDDDEADDDDDDDDESDKQWAVDPARRVAARAGYESIRPPKRA